MAISKPDDYFSALKQKLKFNKTATRTSAASSWVSLLDLDGDPVAGTLAAGNIANGLVPTGQATGYPAIKAFNTGAKGYLSIVEFASSVAERFMLYDRLFHAGAYAFNANVTLASQPSFVSRIQDGSYVGTEPWIEAVTAFIGNLSIAVTYTNQDGVAARTTGTVSTGVAPIVGRMLQLPLQAGDTGVQKVESVK